MQIDLFNYQLSSLQLNTHRLRSVSRCALPPVQLPPSAVHAALLRWERSGRARMWVYSSDPTILNLLLLAALLTQAVPYYLFAGLIVPAVFGVWSGKECV